MHRSEKEFIKFIKPYKLNFLKIESLGFPDFIVFNKKKIIFVEVKRYIKSKKPSFSMLTNEQKNFFTKYKGLCYLFFTPSTYKSGNLYNNKLEVVSVREVI